MSINQILQDLVNKSDEEKMSLIASNYKDIYRKLIQFDDEPDGDGHYTTMIILAAAVCADGQLDPYEAAVVSSIMGAIGYNIPESKLPEIFRNIASDCDVYEILANFMSTLDNEEKASLAVFIAAVCSIDDKLTKNEVALIKDMLGE